MTNSQFRPSPLVAASAALGLRAFALNSCIAALALSLCSPPQAQAGSFLPANPMLTARFNHTATLLPNGKVLIAGGMSGGQAPAAFSSTGLCDPEYEKESPLR
jgi:hypothetical protein